MINYSYQSTLDKTLHMRDNRVVNEKNLMSSRCFISIFKDNFEYDSIFCADGHPEFTGYTLVNHYYRKSDVINLIQDGDVYNLGVNVFECKFYDDRFKSQRTFSSMNSMIDFYRECACDYGYIYIDEEWKSVHITSDDSCFVNLNVLINA